MRIEALAAAALACGLATVAPATAQNLPADTLTVRAVQKMERGDVRGALQDTTAAIQRDPGQSAAYALRGTILLATGELRGAMADLSKAIALTPGVKGMERVYAARANVHWLARDRKAALADIDHALRLNESFGMAYNMRGRVKADDGDLDGAQADFDRAIRLEPRLMAAYSGRAAVNFQAGRLEESIGDYKTILWVTPNDPDAIAGHGVLRGILGETAKGVEDLVKARTLARHSVSPGAGLAVRNLDQFLQMNPGEGRAHLMRAAVSLLNGERDAAEREFAQAVRADASLQADVVAVRNLLKPAS